MSIENVTETVPLIDSALAPIVEENDSIAPEVSAELLPETPSEPLDTLIRVLKDGDCPSLTARSTLGYQLGLKDESELYPIGQQHR